MHQIDQQIRQGLIGGAVVLAGSQEKDLFAGAWGYADWKDRRSMTMDTIFDIASVTKPVGTNSVLLAAVADGLLDLGRPFTDYLPEFTGSLPDPVTVRELALHVSGVNISYCRTGTAAEMRRDILAVDFLKPPRTEYQYTCTNFILIGFLLEKIYGRSLAGIAAERVFRPLQMNETEWTKPVEGGLPRTIRTINADPGIISDEGARNFVPDPLGNAGIFCTAADLAKYARMMLRNDGSIFPPDVLELCFTDFNPAGVAHPRSVGWDKMPDMIPAGLSAETIFHNGWTGQTFWVDRGTGRFVIVLTNRMKPWDRAKFGRKAIAEEALAAIGGGA